MAHRININKIVVKIEIQNLLDEKGELDFATLDRLAMILSNIQNSGKKISIVSSGAILLGAKKLNQPIPEDFTDKQAVAAIGQAELIKMYQKVFREYNQVVSQVLLTKDIVNSNDRRNNAKNTLYKLLEMNIIPVINENDAISVDDIKLEDNYPVAVNVANIIDASFILVKCIDNAYIILERGNKIKDRISESQVLDYFEDKQAEVSSEGGFPENYKNGQDNC